MIKAIDLISLFRASAKNPENGSTRVWTLEQRAAASERARKSRPWLRSTGPKTTAGKARCARNALKHGYYSAASRAKRLYHRAHRAFQGHAMALIRLQNYLVKSCGYPYNPAIKGLWEVFGRSLVHAPSRTTALVFYNRPSARRFATQSG